MTRHDFSGLGFIGARIDRSDHRRTDAAWLDDARTRPTSRCLSLNGLDPIPCADGLTWTAAAFVPDDTALIFIGVDDDGNACFVPEAAPAARIDGRSRTAMRVLPMLPSDQAALYGGARSLVDWHARHRFCAACGGATVLAKGGWQRTCTACSAEHFPRVDPVTIMLALHGDRALVGRQHGYPPRMYSALAGFVEPGESLEEAVARELFEEAGVRANDVRYVTSQPWPFPSSLMIGCMADVADAALTLDTTEIEDAIWITRDEAAAALAHAPDAPFHAPPSLAIAHHLLRYWIEGGT